MKVCIGPTSLQDVTRGQFKLFSGKSSGNSKVDLYKLLVLPMDKIGLVKSIAWATANFQNKLA